jgi:alpha-L-fucosidase
MYIQGNRQYEYHVKTYGHPTKVGYKDVIPIWKADKFDPDHLLGLYKKAGTKYFCSMAVHHDGFDLWNRYRETPIATVVTLCARRNITVPMPTYRCSPEFEE